tara:strand:- start:666 stop:902 length:237 start_codon:yes stop_codon:yes gene_type:complete
VAVERHTNGCEAHTQVIKMIIKMNEIVLDMEEVESIEWKHDGGEAYSVRFHMKSGKMFTRIVHKNQLDTLIEDFKEEE